MALFAMVRHVDNISVMSDPSSIIPTILAARHLWKPVEGSMPFRGGTGGYSVTMFGAEGSWTVPEFSGRRVEKPNGFLIAMSRDLRDGSLVDF